MPRYFAIFMIVGTFSSVLFALYVDWGLEIDSILQTFSILGGTPLTHEFPDGVKATGFAALGIQWISICSYCYCSLREKPCWICKVAAILVFWISACFVALCQF